MPSETKHPFRLSIGITDKEILVSEYDSQVLTTVVIV